MEIKTFPISRESLTIAFHKKYDTSTEEGRSLERRRRIALTSFTSIISRVLSMAIPLITLKITYSYLGVEVYGLWSVVITFFALFAFSDLGLGNGLQTKLSQANGKDDIELCRKIISNTYSILLVVAGLLLVIFLAIFKFVDWANVMNAKSNETILIASSVVFVIVIPKLLSIPIAIIQRTQLALQEGYKNEVWNIIGTLFSLLSIVIIAKLDLGKITLLAVSSLLPVFISGLNMFVFFNIQRKEFKISLKLLDLKIAKNLLSLGIYFCILSILTTIGLSMDTFIVARTCTLSDAASYSIIYKISAIISSVVGIFSAPLWGANGEAIARGDVRWVKNNTKRMSLMMVTVTTVISIIALISIKFVFKIWLGEDFTFSYFSFIWLCIMQILLSFISPYFMVLNAYGIVKKQIMLFAIYTPISFTLKYYFSSVYGITAIPMLGTITYFVIIIFGTYYFSNRQLNR